MRKMTSKPTFPLKRLLDLLIVIGSAPVTIPLCLIVSAAVRLKLGSPVIFAQDRTGLYNRPFQVLKFRTMTDARDIDGFLLPDRKRLTALGALLRKTSLDELPQLLNIFRGEMSLVGPRPLFPRYMPFYRPEEARRHCVRPGITGLAQTSGRNAVGWDQRLKLDVEYVDRWSLLLDLRILLRTVKQVFASEGVSVIAGDSGAPLDVQRRVPAGRSVRVQPLTASDLEERNRLMSEPEVRRFMQLPEVTTSSTVAWFERVSVTPGRHDFVIRSSSPGEVVGMAGLRDTGDGAAEFYIFIDPLRAGSGFGHESSQLLFDWALTVMDYDRVTLTVDVENASALRIYERSGFTVVARSPDRLEMALHAGG